MSLNCGCSPNGVCREHQAYIAERDRRFGDISAAVSEADEIAEAVRAANVRDAEEWSRYEGAAPAITRPCQAAFETWTCGRERESLLHRHSETKGCRCSHERAVDCHPYEAPFAEQEAGVCLCGATTQVGKTCGSCGAS